MIARAVSELLLLRARRWQEQFSDKRHALLIAESILSASIAHLPAHRRQAGDWIGIEDAVDHGRRVSAMAIAHAMHLPYSTMARRVTQLVSEGWLVKDGGGLRVSPDRFTRRQLAEIASGDAAGLLSALAMLVVRGYAPAADALDAGIAALPDGVLARAMLDFSLRMLESLADLYGDAVDGVVNATIVAANVRHITNDPELSRRFAGEEAPPPDAMRRPVGLRELARQVDMPFETVRRRVNAMIARDMVVQVDGGVVVPARFLMSPAQRRNNRRTTRNFGKMLRELETMAAACRNDPPE